MSAPRHPATVEALIRGLIPVVCPERGAGLDDDIVDHTAASLGAAPAHIRHGLHAAAVAYELGALAFPALPPRRAHRLPLEARSRYFRLWYQSPLLPQREFAKAVKGFIGLAYYEHPQTRQRLGYDPQGWTEKVKARRLATHGDDIAAHERAITAPDPLPRGFFQSVAKAEDDGEEAQRAS